MRIAGAVALALISAVAATCASQARFSAEAVRLNNRGVAQMGQQFTDRAADSFAEAFKKDPKLVQAAINRGIALMTLQKLDEAKQSLQQALLSQGLARVSARIGGNACADALLTTECAARAGRREIWADPNFAPL